MDIAVMSLVTTFPLKFNMCDCKNNVDDKSSRVALLLLTIVEEYPYPHTLVWRAV